MRILGFCKEWDKLKKPIHTTFRFPRKDTDWAFGEVVQEVYKPRSKEHKFIQIATIINKTPKQIRDITEAEAIEDGFENAEEMRLFLGKPDMDKTINQLTLEVKP